MARDKCPNCGYPLKVVIARDMTRAKGKSYNFQHTIPTWGLAQLIHRVWKDRPLWFKPDGQNNNDEADHELWSNINGTVKIETLEGVTKGEFKRIAWALSRNDWRWSRAALRDAGFSDTRAYALGRVFNKAGLRYVDRQNRSHLAPHLMPHLYRCLSE